MKLATQKALKKKAISHGSLGLEYRACIGGLPKGRVIEVYGPESSGKDTLRLALLSPKRKRLAYGCLC